MDQPTPVTIISVEAKEISGAMEVTLHTSEGVNGVVELTFGKTKREERENMIDTVNNIICPKLTGKNLMNGNNLGDIDNILVHERDVTKKLGGNSVFAMSLAFCKALALTDQTPFYKYIATLAGNYEQFDGKAPKMVLPIPGFTVITYGSHEENTEFMILPFGASSFKEAVDMCMAVRDQLKDVIEKEYGTDATNVGDEGAFAPNIQKDKKALKLLKTAIKTAIKKAGYTRKVGIGMNVAASKLNSSDQTYKDLTKLCKSSGTKYPILSVQYSFGQNDFESCAKIMTTQVGEKVQIVGDDLLVTNPERVDRAINEKHCNALLLKANQMGTVTESIQLVKKLKAASWTTMFDHGLGKIDETVSDLCLALSIGQIKTGFSNSDVYKQTEEHLGELSVYGGVSLRKPVVYPSLRLSVFATSPIFDWWDIENNLVPFDMKPSDVYDCIKTTLVNSGFTGQLTIQAVAANKLPVGTDQTSLKNIDLRILVGQEGVKNAADADIKMRIKQWKKTHPPPAIVMITTGDWGFSGVLRELQDEGYFTIVARRVGAASDKVCAFANKVFTWRGLLGLSESGKRQWLWPSGSQKKQKT